MQTLQHHFPVKLVALSIGSSAAKACQKMGPIGHVQSVFTEAINVQLDNGRMMSVVGPSVGRGPINILVDGSSPVGPWTRLGVSKGDWVNSSNGSLLVANRLDISLGHAEAYERAHELLPRLGSVETVQNNVSVLGKSLELQGQAQSLYRRFHDDTSSDVHSSIVGFNRAVRSRSPVELSHAARQLVGLGPGLTPAGDDLLSGWMIASTIFAENLGGLGVVHSANRRIVSHISGLTTKLSEEYLLQASEGQASEHIVRLVHSLLTGNNRGVENAAGRVLIIGAGSGTDLAFGVYLGAKATLDSSLLLPGRPA